MKLPQPIPYQGSKRQIAKQILRYVPATTERFVELFAGSAALSVALAHKQVDTQFVLNDINRPLMNLLTDIVERPNRIAEQYTELWQAQLGQERTYYDWVRAQFNETHEPRYLLYLLARCVKASVRYNGDGQFNQSPDNRRRGRKPAGMRREIELLSQLLHGRTTITGDDYRDVAIDARSVVYLDPPYQGTSGQRDRRYYDIVSVDDLIMFLERLNRQDVSFLMSYDGRTGGKQYGRALPDHLKLKRVEIAAGRSTQSTLLGGKERTWESLYISPALCDILADEQRSEPLIPYQPSLIPAIPA